MSVFTRIKENRRLKSILFPFLSVLLLQSSVIMGQGNPLLYTVCVVSRKVLREKLDLLEVKERHPMSLSGGQKQRVAIASAILGEKQILVFDEPTSGLDQKHMEETADVIRSISRDKTILIVTHDPDLIVRCCTHILHLEHGKVKQFYPLETGMELQFQTFFERN